MKKLYEIKFKREYVGYEADGFFEKEKLYQVVAFDEYGACAKLGQLFPNDDFYIHILDVKEV